MKLRSQCCKDCQRRHKGCHSDCEDYLAAKKELDELKKQMQAAAANDGYFVAVARRKQKAYREKSRK